MRDTVVEIICLWQKEREREREEINKQIYDSKTEKNYNKNGLVLLLMRYVAAASN